MHFDAPFDELKLKDMIVEFWALIMDASVQSRIAIEPTVFQCMSHFIA